MKRSITILLALIVLFAMPVLASTPEQENAPLASEDELFLGEMSQLSEEELINIEGNVIKSASDGASPITSKRIIDEIRNSDISGGSASTVAGQDDYSNSIIETLFNSFKSFLTKYFCSKNINISISWNHNNDGTGTITITINGETTIYTTNTTLTTEIDIYLSTGGSINDLIQVIKDELLGPNIMRI